MAEVRVGILGLGHTNYSLVPSSEGSRCVGFAAILFVFLLGRLFVMLGRFHDRIPQQKRNLSWIAVMVTMPVLRSGVYSQRSAIFRYLLLTKGFAGLPSNSEFVDGRMEGQLAETGSVQAWLGNIAQEGRR